MVKRDVQVHIVKTMENLRKKLRDNLTTEDLAVWFGTKKKPKGSKQPKGPWVNICRKEDGKHPPCGRDKATGKGYPKCRAVGVAAKMTDEQKRAACAQKRRVEKTHSKAGKGNAPAMASYKPRKESMKKTITLKESELISLIERMIIESSSNNDPEKREKDIERIKTLVGEKNITDRNKLLLIMKNDWVIGGNPLRKFPREYYFKLIKSVLSNISYKGVISSNKNEVELNYPFIINILKKMYGYEVSMDDLKTFENTTRYDQTNNSYDYIEQYNDYMDEMKGVKSRFDRLKLKEETGTSSTGSYETPGFLAKNIPNMRQGAKTTYGGPGGKFVKIKAKCRKFPYCSQGAVDAPLELSNKYKGESSLSGEMKLTPTYPKGYKGNVHLTKTKWVNEEAIPGGKSNGMSIKDIAKKHKVSPQIAMKEWLRGIKVEMEHTTNKRIAREIAKDHLYEDIYYYKKLSKIEK